MQQTLGRPRCPRGTSTGGLELECSRARRHISFLLASDRASPSGWCGTRKRSASAGYASDTSTAISSQDGMSTAREPKRFPTSSR